MKIGIVSTCSLQLWPSQWLRIYIQGGPKNGYPVLFGDNFGNSAPILTILSLLQAEMYGAKFFHPPNL